LPTWPPLPEFATRLPVSPNPTSGPVTFRFALPSGSAAGAAALEIYDVAGRHVRSLVPGDDVAGTRELRWDLRDQGGQRIRNGIYLAQWKSGKSLSRAVRFAVIGR
jgi:flagellar hook assembly protein FlgD